MSDSAERRGLSSSSDSTKASEAPRLSGTGHTVKDLQSGCRVQGAGCRVRSVRCRVQGAGCRVQGAGLNV
jgi:hypothetical protein